jgi:hypothetical protein
VLINIESGVKMIGFRFVITSFFPFSPPLAFLDEPLNQNVIDFIDYVDDGNVINF